MEGDKNDMKLDAKKNDNPAHFFYKWAGFISGGIAVLVAKIFLNVDNLAVLGIIHIGFIFAVEYAHGYSIREIHVTVIFFWLAYFLAKNGNMSLVLRPGGHDSVDIFVPDIILSLMVGSYLAGGITSLKNRFKKEEKKGDEKGEKIGGGCPI